MPRISDEPTPLEPFVLEAIARFGWVRTDALPALLSMIGDGQNQRLWRNADVILRNGQRIGPDERSALGLARYGERLTWEAWRTLTGTGREDPHGRFTTTVWRSLCNARTAARRRDDQGRLEKAWPFPYARIYVPPAGACCMGQALADSLVTRIPKFPLPGCDHPVCHCGWRLVTAREVPALRTT